MDETAKELAAVLVSKLGSIPPSARLLVAIAGLPASGKSTLAVLVVDHVNTLLAKANAGHASATPLPQAIMIGLDGWHLTRAQLDTMDNPKLAHGRRGAHWTFDGRSYVSFVHLLRAPGEHTAVITAPSFDHALKDPTPDAVAVYPHHRIVVIEGLYTMLDADVWRAAAEAMDERWWIDVDWEVARERLVKRHVLTGVAKDIQEANWRADENDRPNGKFVVDNLYKPTRSIRSIDDPLYTLS
ncbi:P-loop containing nucleoside triphosphate hydrolase protein [Pisolithus marmoratus]|nr:P-loop containing nucleoside triphosphate hydrolase protein [Pisolithus marmoratus]